MLLFHGTTLENALRIKEEGFCYNKKNWSCSREETYFFTEEFFRKEFDEEEWGFSYFWDRCIEHTIDQARIGLAVENPSDYRAAVLVFDTDLMDNGDDIEPDTSCRNMKDTAVALHNPDMKGLVAVIYTNSCERESRALVLASIASMEHFDLPEVSDITRHMIDALVNSEQPFCIWESLNDYTEVTTEWINDNYLELNQDHFQEVEIKAA